MIESEGVVGIGIYSGNARRDHEIGREARKRGAWVIFQSIHATLFLGEGIRRAAHSAVRGDGHVIRPQAIVDSPGALARCYIPGPANRVPVALKTLRQMRMHRDRERPNAKIGRVRRSGGGTRAVDCSSGNRNLRFPESDSASLH